MGDSTTVVLHLTFFGTLGIAFLMFAGLFLLVILTLILAGTGRLLVLTAMTLLGRRPKSETLPLARLTGASEPPSDAVKNHNLLSAVRKEPPVLAEDWAAAVAEADARAMARARAVAPEFEEPVRELPGPTGTLANVKAVAPLVESALHQDISASDTTGSNAASPVIPALSFTKPPAPAPLSLLDTGSLVSLSGPEKVLKTKLPADGG